MIILISLIVIGLILLTLLIIGLKFWGWDYEYDGYGILMGIASGLFIGAAFICSIVCAVININPEPKVIEIEERITYLENRKEMLESVKPVITPEGEVLELTSDIYLHFDNVQEYYSAVNAYNKEVKDLNIEVKSGRQERNNKWISWFISPAYSMIDISKINSLSYSLGK